MPSMLAEMSSGSFAVVAAVGLITCMLLVRSQRQMKAATMRQPAAQPSPRAPAKGEPRGAEQWEVRMYELARELSGQLDSKMVAVELLVREAQEQIVRLESLLGRDEQRRTAAMADGTPAAHSGTQAAALPHSSQRPHVLARNKPRSHQEIYALADAGHSSQAIAARLGTPVGEVELILGLRRPSR